MSSPFEFRLTDFSGGLNTRRSPYLIADNEASYLRNVEIDGSDIGALKKRNGWTKLNSTALTDSGGIFSLYRAWFSDATSIIVASSHTKTVRWDGTTFQDMTTGLTSEQRFGYTMFNSLMISGNATESTKKMNSAGTESALSGSPPNAKYFTSWRNRVWAAGNTTNPNRLYFSALNNEEDWTTAGDSGTIDIDKDSGDVITGIIPQGNRLLVFKNSAIYTVNFISTQQTDVFPVTTKLGTISARSLVDADGAIVFLHGGGAWTRGVYAIDQNNGIQLLSEKITPTLEESASTSLQTACAAFYKNSYILCVDNGGSGDNNVIYKINLRTGAWGYDTGVPCNSIYADTRLGTQRLLGGHATLGTIMNLDVGANDNTATINFVWRSKHFSFGKPEARKAILDIHIMGKKQAGTITADAYINGTSTSWAKTFTLNTGSNDVDFETLHPPDAQMTGNAWGLELAANTTSALTIHSIALRGEMLEVIEDGA